MFSSFSATTTTTTATTTTTTTSTTTTTTTAAAATAATTATTSSSSSVFTSLNDRGRGKDGHYSGEMFVCVCPFSSPLMNTVRVSQTMT